MSIFDPSTRVAAGPRADFPQLGGERRKGDAARIAEVLRTNGRIALRVHGTSMLPWVKPADVALIRQTAGDSVRFGDVVLFRRGERLFVHRIVQKRGPLGGEQFIVKGDAHPTADGELGPEEVLGRVVRIYRGGKRIDLDAPGQLAKGLLIAELSLWSKVWYPAVKVAAVTTRPMRRLLAMIM
jgi:signal peptidase I